ncbi:SET domain-containing protein SmydA-8 [Anopheles bellator]|uniref:SET domain-containing protein SmydA-8 n=1 Tax=Anopheles bellator TaxID=139047 RepID=UPI002647BD51|nr:SET domain-containing protein SmydA-8 [Anopheles bellator]
MDETYRVLESPELGRYGVAARDLRAGERLFVELPFAIGPKLDSPPLCLECCCPVDGGDSGPRCPRCGWPLCEDCAAVLSTPELATYHRAECAVFAEKCIRFQAVEDSTAGCVQLDCITPLRVLLAAEVDRERWEREIAPMEYHGEARRDEANWTVDEHNIVEFLRGPCGLADRFSAELIQQVIGLLDVNAFEGRTCNGYSVRGLYPQLAIMAHNCVPNVVHSIHPSEDFRLEARIAVDVADGETLYTTYTYTLTGTVARQSILKASKFFTCLCARCVDPTELGTHFSSLLCSKCVGGLVVSTNPIDEQADWKCGHCDFKIAGAIVQKAVITMHNELDELVCLEYDAGRLEAYERLYKKFRTVLHPLHFINTAIRHSLIELYGRIPGYEMAELPDVLLERKVELCRDVLRVLDVFEPGRSRSRAMVLYELHAPLIVLAQSGFARGEEKRDGKTLKQQLTEAATILEECGSILEWEDPTTPEGILANVAKQSLLQLQQSIDSLD